MRSKACASACSPTPAALDALAADHPGLDRSRLAALIARARAERAGGEPPHAYRELFRELKALD